MPQAPHHPAPTIETLQLRSGRVDVLRQLQRAAAYARPGTEPVGPLRLTTHFLRCTRHLETFRDWFGNPDHRALQEALAWRPSLALCVVHPYLNTAWPAEHKLDVIATHYDMLRGRLGFLRFAPHASIAVADVGAGIQIRLDKPGKFEHEGELTINLFSGELRLYSLTFTLGRLATQRVAYAGGLQGLGSPDALEIYRTLTHRMHGLRPRDLLITAFRVLCLALGVARILAIGDRHRVSTSAYFKSSTLVFTSYDSAWVENGGAVAADDGFFELSPHVDPRAVRDIPSRKRAQYRRRYALVETLSREIGDTLKLASRPHAMATIDRA